MELISLNATLRSSIGNGPARTLRRGGSIPAVLYGPKTEPVLLAVEIRDLENALKKGNIGQSLFSLNIDGGSGSNKTVMIKELQLHPSTSRFIHADFYELPLDRKTTVSIPVVAEGTAKGVEEGGILQIIRRELDIYCLPTQIPESITLDITDLEIGDSIHVEDIQLGEEVEILADVNFTVITVSSPKMEELPEEGEEEDVDEEGEEAAEAAEDEEGGESEPE